MSTSSLDRVDTYQAGSVHMEVLITFSGGIITQITLEIKGRQEDRRLLMDTPQHRYRHAGLS
ncbi:MAG: hypothetical protein M2R45_02984 [Verrucomicrobia subdivision 3 bacterium]|nr:hypothetical protein [Limisphaerales bacterium]MCS1416530.1 hypothetical protein [Limisphaerales bacterium]